MSTTEDGESPIYFSWALKNRVFVHRIDDIILLYIYRHQY